MGASDKLRTRLAGSSRLLRLSGLLLAVACARRFSRLDAARWGIDYARLQHGQIIKIGLRDIDFERYRGLARSHLSLLR